MAGGRAGGHSKTKSGGIREKDGSYRRDFDISDLGSFKGCAC
jgi:hypothetical protein